MTGQCSFRLSSLDSGEHSKPNLMKEAKEGKVQNSLYQRLLVKKSNYYLEDMYQTN